MLVVPRNYCPLVRAAKSAETLTRLQLGDHHEGRCRQLAAHGDSVGPCALDLWDHAIHDCYLNAIETMAKRLLTAIRCSSFVHILFCAAQFAHLRRASLSIHFDASRGISVALSDISPIQEGKSEVIR
ncbi:hypothetical protein F441_21367 [Phytophthora nicotianae CJ01A1]|uniref:Uncharacterized protein n=5 Tax=Phytophthora nicotianae TaxID=4792 RepID=V9DXF8_PHYNI|nr:hypothetical protein F443_21481 [Phytophthora nicotianae P1569]ETK71962.1 hypothetical protein L915_20884 [Phytophthora nicotianae]ETO60290.1 hypothetical protein F444_21498 [Phytophthora nicotianae P1976]ETP01381.1 hypothetical protein F441_21367 [Phytophthora nicotianae CJ01A1]ETP29545.1 hypothetical protein F442_21316 [Phytophthora nicotianae P10297]